MESVQGKVIVSGGQFSVLQFDYFVEFRQGSRMAAKTRPYSANINGHQSAKISVRL